MDTYLLKNNHRVTVVTLPDTALSKKIKDDEQQRLETARGQMSVEDVEKVCYIMDERKAYHEEKIQDRHRTARLDMTLK